MPLPSSGPLSINNIAGEYGGSQPHQMGEYFSGGSNVPSGTEGINGPIPSSGQLKISDFYGSPVSVEPTFDVEFWFIIGQDDDIPPGVFPSVTTLRGWNTVWPDGGYPYGQIDSGNPNHDDGWGIAGITLFRSVDGFDHGYFVNFTNDNYLSSTFLIVLDGVIVLDSDLADNDTTTLVNYAGGVKNVRQLWFNMKSTLPNNWPLGGYVLVQVDRIN